MANGKTFYCWVRLAAAESGAPPDGGASMGSDIYHIRPPGDDDSQPELMAANVATGGATDHVRPPEDEPETDAAPGLATAAVGPAPMHNRPPPHRAYPAEPDADLLRAARPAARPMPELRLASMLDRKRVAAQGFAPAGFAMAGWWGMDTLFCAGTDGRQGIAEYWPIDGSRDDAYAWLRTDDAQQWLRGAHSAMLMMFHVED